MSDSELLLSPRRPQITSATTPDLTDSAAVFETLTALIERRSMQDHAPEGSILRTEFRDQHLPLLVYGVGEPGRGIELKLARSKSDPKSYSVWASVYLWDGEKLKLALTATPLSLSLSPESAAELFEEAARDLTRREGFNTSEWLASRMSVKTETDSYLGRGGLWGLARSELRERYEGEIEILRIQNPCPVCASQMNFRIRFNDLPTRPELLTCWRCWKSE